MKELESMGYLIIKPSQFGKFSVSLNPQKLIQIQRIVTSPKVLS